MPRSRQSNDRRSPKLSAADDWKNLRVGERVRIVRMPSGVDAPGYTFHAETRWLYERLIARGRSHRIAGIDDWGLPFILVRFLDERPVWHFLELNDDSWVRVKPRRRRGLRA